MSEASSVLDVCTELASLLAEHGQLESAVREKDRTHLDLLSALDEIRSWLRDNRTYEPKFHNLPWATVTSDVALVLKTRGHRLALATPSLDALHAQLKLPLLGADAKRREAAKALAESGRQELETEAALLASFDDLFKAISKQATPRPRLLEHTAALHTCLTLATRQPGWLLDSLAGLLRGNAIEVKWAKELRGESVQMDRSDFNTTVNLAIPERQRLCREVIKARAVILPVAEVVWVWYDNATIEFPLDFGPLTFYDKKHLGQIASKEEELAHAINNPDDSFSYRMKPPPPELINTHMPAADDTMWPGWPRLDNYVAVRVDLAQTVPIDAPQEARRQAENAVRTAGFYTGGSSWRLLRGHARFRNNEVAGFAVDWPDHSPQNDETGWTLQRLERRLGAHMPIRDHRLQEVLDAVAVLDIRRHDLDPTAILHTARIIDKIAGICGQPDWTIHLTENFKVQWAKDQVMQLIHVAGWAILHDKTLDVSSMPGLDRLSKSWAEIDLAVAVDCISWLDAEINPRHQLARQVRDLAKCTSTPTKLHELITRFEKNYQRLVDRLLRCRNSLAHGGPFLSATGDTVVRMSWTHAKQTAAITLDALLDGVDPGHAHLKRRIADHQWRDGLPHLARASDAFR